MLRGELYIGSDADSAAEFGRAEELLAEFNGAPPGAWDERRALLRRLLRHVGENVMVRPLLTATHAIDPEPRRIGWESAEPIAIADNVWLGGGVIVCPGVSIGQDTVVGAGAVVTKDLPAGVVAVGVPARILREIGDEDRVEAPASPRTESCGR